MQTVPQGTTRYVTCEGVVTPLFRETIKDVSPLYIDIANFLATKLRRRPLPEYGIREAHIVGSVVRGVDNSDLDVLVIPQKIDAEDYRFFKLAMNDRLFNNRPKPAAIDFYVRPYDEMPDRVAWEVTSQLAEEIGAINRALGFVRPS